MNAENAARATPKPRVSAAVRSRRRAIPAEPVAPPPPASPPFGSPPPVVDNVVPLAVRPPQPIALVPPPAPPAEEPVAVGQPRAAAALPVDSRRKLAATLRIGQIASWQVAIALIGLTVGRPLPIAGPAAACAVLMLALTTVRVRSQWLYQWAWRYVRFRFRDRTRHLPREGASRALLHLFAPDAALTSIRLADTDVAVVSRTCGATAVLRPQLVGEDPVDALPRPTALLPGGDETSALGVQLVFHGVASNRRSPRGWLAVQAIRTPELYEEDDVTQALRNVVQRVLRQLGRRNLAVAGLEEAKMLSTIASLAHSGNRPGDVEELWRCWCCGSIAQAVFRLGGWAGLDDAAARRLLRTLLTAQTGAVLTVAVAAGTVDGEPGEETATVRVAAPGLDKLEAAVAELGALLADRDVRLDRMDGEHVEGVAASLPLGVVR